MVAIQVKLSDWFYNALLGREVLTISEDYFRLRKPIERRIYELARKHCGKQKKWGVGLKLLRKKTGASSPMKEFRRMIHKIVETDHMPDYSLSFDADERDKLIVQPREAPAKLPDYDRPHLKTQTYENAAKALEAHGLDKYAVECEWREWMNEKKPPSNPDAAFIGFCKMKIASL